MHPRTLESDFYKSDTLLTWSEVRSLAKSGQPAWLHLNGGAADIARGVSRAVIPVMCGPAGLNTQSIQLGPIRTSIGFAHEVVSHVTAWGGGSFSLFHATPIRKVLLRERKDRPGLTARIAFFPEEPGDPTGSTCWAWTDGAMRVVPMSLYDLTTKINRGGDLGHEDAERLFGKFRLINLLLPRHHRRRKEMAAALSRADD